METGDVVRMKCGSVWMVVEKVYEKYVTVFWMTPTGVLKSASLLKEGLYTRQEIQTELDDDELQPLADWDEWPSCGRQVEEDNDGQ